MALNSLHPNSQSTRSGMRDMIRRDRNTTPPRDHLSKMLHSFARAWQQWQKSADQATDKMEKMQLVFKCSLQEEGYRSLNTLRTLCWPAGRVLHKCSDPIQSSNVYTLLALHVYFYDVPSRAPEVFYWAKSKKDKSFNSTWL